MRVRRFPLILIWLLLVTIAIPCAAWLIKQITLVQLNLILPSYVWVIIAIIQGCLMGLPLYVFYKKSKYASQIKQPISVLSLAIGINIFFSVFRLIPTSKSQITMIAQIFISSIILWFLNKVLTNRDIRFDVDRSLVFVVLFITPILALPFLLWGALGSLLDTFLSLIAGLLFGLIAGILCDMAWLETEQPEKAMANGFLFGVILLILGGGYGFGGSQMLLMICLPGLGFVSVTIGRLCNLQRNSKCRVWVPV